MDSRLSDDLVDQEMLGVFIYFLRFLSFNRFSCLFWFEDIKGEALFLGEGSVDNELVLFIGMSEVYDLFTIIINVSRVIIVIFDVLLWRDKFTNIRS